VINYGCSVQRIDSARSNIRNNKDISQIRNFVLDNNLTNENFYLQKGVITLKNEKEERKFIYSVKFNIPDKYLISIKNKVGVEGARIYLSKDTILINDRINRKLLYGNQKDMEKISGFSFFALNMLFGDLAGIEENTQIESKVNNNMMELRYENSGIEVKAAIDLKVNKVRNAECLNKRNNDIFRTKYIKFSKEEKHIPRKIQIENEKENFTARISIFKLQVPWDGRIDFISGKGYSKERIK
jgi:hypothetical protein